MKLLLTLFIISAGLVLITGCTNGAGAIDNPDRSASEAGDRNAAVLPPKDTAMEDVEGVVVYDADEKKLEKNSGLITIYGKGGEPMKVINREDESLDSLTGEEGDFYPFYFSNGASRDFGIELRAVRRSKDWIEVIVHETREPNTLGYVRVDDTLFRFLSWSEWVKEHSNIRFDTKEDPVLDSPNGKPAKVTFPEEALIKSDEVRGDWARIRWTELEPDELSADQIGDRFPANVGWIRWRKDGRVLIREYYP